MKDINELKEKIKELLKEDKELYDYFLDLTDESNFNHSYYEKRCHEIKIEMMTYEDILFMIEGSDKE